MAYTFDLYFREHYLPVIKETMEDYLNTHLTIPFYQILNKYLAKKHLLKREISGLSGIDRRTIYKIYHQKDFVPTKRMVICLGLGMRLDIHDFEAFMHEAGYHFSSHQKRDVVIMYCLKEGIYALTDIDLYLDRVGEKPLIGLK